jgi:hypothetical protein
MKYLTEYGIPGVVPHCVTVEDVRQYLNSDPHPECKLVNFSWMHSGDVLMIWELPDDKSVHDHKLMLEACQKAWRKHVVDDPGIGWEELGELLGATLAQVMGDQGFVEWMDQVNPEKTI